MNPRVVLYAEGRREDLAGLSGGLVPAPGDPFHEENLGPAHHVVRRALATARGVPEAAVRFEGPLRVRGRLPRGSDLLHRRTLRQLLTWPNPRLRPDLAIVLVDADEDSNRREELVSHMEGLPSSAPCVVAVAVQEFEAWLIADVKAAGTTLGARLDEASLPESMHKREAKSVLGDWTSRGNRDPRQIRLDIARTCNLEVVARRCPAFRRFLEDLKAR